VVAVATNATASAFRTLLCADDRRLWAPTISLVPPTPGPQPAETYLFGGAYARVVARPLVNISDEDNEGGAGDLIRTPVELSLPPLECSLWSVSSVNVSLSLDTAGIQAGHANAFNDSRIPGDFFCSGLAGHVQASYSSVNCSLSLSSATAGNRTVAPTTLRDWLLCVRIRFDDLNATTAAAQGGGGGDRNVTVFARYAVAPSTLRRPALNDVDTDFFYTLPFPGAFTLRTQGSNYGATTPVLAASTLARAYGPDPSARIREGTSPAALLSAIGGLESSASGPGAITVVGGSVVRARVVFDENCDPDADSLFFDPDAVTAFLAANPGAAVTPGTRATTGCPISLSVWGSGLAPLDSSLSPLLSSLRLTVGPRNSLPATAYRRVALQLFDTHAGGCPTEISFGVSVTPAADPVRIPGVGLGLGAVLPVPLPEAAGPPIVELTVAVSCSHPDLRATAAASGAVCLEDPDPAVASLLLRDWTAASARPLDLLQISRYRVELSPATAPSPAGAGPGASVLFTFSAEAPPVYDCARAAVDQGRTQWAAAGVVTAAGTAAGAVYPPRLTWTPLPCFRQRFRLWPASLDFENPDHPRNFSVTVRVTDELVDDPGNATVLDGLTLNVTLQDVDDAATIALTRPARGADLVFDEREDVNGPHAAVGLDFMTVTDQDAVDADAHDLVLVSPLAPESSTLVNGQPFTTALVASKVGTATTAGTVTGYTELWTIKPRPGTFLSQAGFRTSALPLRVHVNSTKRWAAALAAAGGSADAALAALPSLNIRIVIVRTNAQVNVTVFAPSGPFATTPVPASASVLPLAENAPVGTVACIFEGADMDEGQSFTFTLLSVLTGDGTVQPLLPGLLRLDTAPATSVSVYDPSTGTTGTRQVTRRASLVVARDALDYDDGDRVLHALVRVTDNGVFNSSSLYAGAPTTDVRNVTFLLSAAPSPTDTPFVASLDRIPSGGFNVHGGDVVELVGTGLGLSEGPSKNVTAWAVSADGVLNWRLEACEVVTRLVRVRCTVPAGWGQNLTVRVSVGGGGRFGQAVWSTLGGSGGHGAPTLSYQLPLVTSVLAYGPVSTWGVPAGLLAAPPETLLPTNGTTGVATSASPFDGGLAITVWGLPPASVVPDPAVFNVSLVSGPRVVYLDPCARTGPRTLLCPVPPATGAGLAVRVTLMLPTGGGATPLSNPLPVATSQTPVVSFSPPSVSNVSVSGFTLTVDGANLGIDDGLSDGALDRVEYAADPLAVPLSSPTRCALVAGWASCGLLLARACVYTAPHAQVVCALDPDGYGVGFRVRVWVGGQPSEWSAATVGYPAPRITLISTVPTAGLAPDPSGTLNAAVGGDSLIRIEGTGFVANNATSVVVGGVPVAASFVFVGPGTGGVDVGAGDRESGVAPAFSATVLGGSACRAAAPGYSISDPTRVNTTLVAALLIYAPPGFGVVTVEVRVGNRTATFPLPYTAPTIDTLQWVQGDALPNVKKTIRMTGSGFSRCALCYDSASWRAGPNTTVVVAPESCAVPTTLFHLFHPDRLGLSGPPVNVTAGNVTIRGAGPGSSVAELACPAAAGVVLLVSTYEMFGDISLNIGSLSPTVYANYTFTALLNFVPTVLSATPSTCPSGTTCPWDPNGGEDITMVVENGAPDGGSVLLFGYAGAVTLDCPTVWSTSLRADGTARAWSRLGGRFAVLPSNITAVAIALASGRRANVTSFVTVSLGNGPSLTPIGTLSLALSPDIQNRMVYNSLTETWTFVPDLPCRVKVWIGQGQGSKADVILSSPPWSGAAQLTVLSGGSRNIEKLVGITYRPPTIRRITPGTEGATSGNVVVIEGDYFGRFTSLGRAWAALSSPTAVAPAVSSTTGSLPTNGTDPLVFGTNRIVFAYAGATESRERLCANISSWNTTTIVCTAPIGCPSGTATYVNEVDVIIHDSSGDVRSTVKGSYQYAAASLARARIARSQRAITRGGFEVTLLGNNLGLFAALATPSPSPAPSSTSTPSSTASPTATSTRTPSPSNTTGASPSPSRSQTPTASPTPSRLPSGASRSPSPTPSVSRLAANGTVAGNGTGVNGTGVNGTSVNGTSASPSPSPSPSRPVTASSSPTPSTSTVRLAANATGAGNSTNATNATGGGRRLLLEEEAGAGEGKSEWGDAETRRGLGDSRMLQSTSAATVSASATSSATSSLSATQSASRSAAATVSVRGSPSVSATATATSSVSRSSSVTPSRLPPGANNGTSSGLNTTATNTTAGTNSSAPSRSPSPTPTPSRRPGASVSPSTTPLPDPDLENLFPVPPGTFDVSGDFWRALILVSGTVGSGGRILGLVDGAEKATEVPITAHTHDRVRFVMPPFEGTVDIQIAYRSVRGNEVRSSTVTFTAAQPFIAAISALVGDRGTGDPCLALNTSGTANATSNNQCTEDARAVSTWDSYPLDSSRPCIRAHQDGTSTTLLISGTDFGSGNSPVSVIVGQREVACRAPLGQKVYVDDTTLQCDMEKDLFFGPANVSVSIAYSSTQAAAANIIPVAVCACGKYPNPKTGFCEDCPDGASCAGGLDRPRPLPDFWETFPDEWSQRYIDVAAPRGQNPIAPFVPCAVLGMCLPNQNCRIGSSGWMCVSCRPGFKRGLDGKCDLCNNTEVAGSSAALVIVGLVILVGLYLYKRKKNRADELAKLAASKSTMDNLPHGGRKGRKGLHKAADDDGDTPNFVTLIKVGTTFAQTLAALASYTEPARLEVSEDDVGLVPNVLQSWKVFADFGMSLKAVQCSVGVDFASKLIAYIVAPLLALFGVPLMFSLFFAVTQLPFWPSSLGKPTRKSAIEDASFYTSLAVFAALPPSIAALARAQNCAPTSRGFFLMDNPEVSCADPEFISLQRIAFVFGIIYLLIPLVIASLLLPVTILYPCLRKKEDRDWTRERFKFLWDGYVDDSPSGVPFIWECLVLMRKGLFMGISTGFVFFTDSRTQLLTTMLLLALSFAAHGATFPYKSDAINLLELVALGGELLFGFSMMVRVAAGSAGTMAMEAKSISAIPTAEIYVYDIISLAVGALFCLAWVLAIIDRTVNKGKGAKKFARKLGFGATRGGPSAGGARNAASGRFLARSPSGRDVLDDEDEGGVGFRRRGSGSGSLQIDNPMLAALEAKQKHKAKGVAGPRSIMRGLPVPDAPKLHPTGPRAAVMSGKAQSAMRGLRLPAAPQRLRLLPNSILLNGGTRRDDDGDGDENPDEDGAGAGAAPPTSIFNAAPGSAFAVNRRRWFGGPVNEDVDFEDESEDEDEDDEEEEYGSRRPGAIVVGRTAFRPQTSDDGARVAINPFFDAYRAPQQMGPAAAIDFEDEDEDDDDDDDDDRSGPEVRRGVGSGAGARAGAAFDDESDDEDEGGTTQQAHGSSSHVAGRTSAGAAIVGMSGVFLT
jgi:hypothetical protein